VVVKVEEGTEEDCKVVLVGMEEVEMEEEDMVGEELVEVVKEEGEMEEVVKMEARVVHIQITLPRHSYPMK
jgi:hypothetical protein